MKIFFLISFLSLIFIPLQVNALEIETEYAIETVEKFIYASENGDIGLLKTLITGPYYDKRKSLLEDNEGYSDFLKKYFQDITLEILEVKFNNHYNYAFVKIKKEMHNIDVINFELILIKDEMGIWRVFDEVLD